MQRQQLELTTGQPEPVAVARCLPRADEDDDPVLGVQQLVYLVMNALGVRAKRVSQRHSSTPGFSSTFLPTVSRLGDV
jgi:hypothetical protein